MLANKSVAELAAERSEMLHPALILGVALLSICISFLLMQPTDLTSMAAVWFSIFAVSMVATMCLVFLHKIVGQVTTKSPSL